MRPALVIRPARMPQSWQKDKRMAADKLVRLLVFCMEYMMKYMLLPGRVEGGVVLVDMTGLTSTQVPVGPLKSIIGVMANHYVNRIFRFYMLNVPMALSMSAQLAMKFLTERQRQKIHIVKDFRELQQEFAAHQLERDFGGSSPNAKQFFPFPLPAGPFEAGATAGPRPDAIPGVHAALTTECLQGKPWDPELSLEENRRLRYTPAASEILSGQLAKACLPPPPPPTETMAVQITGLPETELAAQEAAIACEGGDHEVSLPSSPEAASASEASDSDDSGASREAQSPARGGKDESGSASPSTGDGMSCLSLPTDEPQSACADSVVLEDKEVHSGGFSFCMPFQCTVGLLRAA